jgi:hypothetical protein
MSTLDSSDIMEMGAMRQGPINSTINNTDPTYSIPDGAPGCHTAHPSIVGRAINMCLGALKTANPSAMSNPEMRASMFTKSN